MPAGPLPLPESPHASTGLDIHRRGVGLITGSNSPPICLDGIRIADQLEREPAAAMYPEAASGVILIETVTRRAE